jgi:tRNA G18 (ribose-2'-O)-methylase SpoU
MNLVTIDRSDDPRIAAYVDVRERDLRGRDGAFLAEGDVVVRVLVARRPYPITSVLVSERRVESLRPLLAELGDAPIYVAAQPVMDAIVGFHLHRGLLALGARGVGRDLPALLDALPAQATVVAALGVTNHDNLGGIFRNAAAFGAGAVLLDETACDPLYRKAIRVSVGGALLVPFARAATGALLDALTARGFELIALTPRGERRIDGLPPAPRRALLLGTEGPGLDEAVMARATRVRIDMAPGFDSLNVAVACGIALHAVSSATSR